MKTWTLPTLTVSALTSLLLLHPFVLPARSQEFNRCFTSDTIGLTPDSKLRILTRAKNLARQAAERANGGLSRYRAAPVMHGPAELTPCEVNPDGTLTFTFPGTAPGSTVPYVETAVIVNIQTWQVQVDRNTPLL